MQQLSTLAPNHPVYLSQRTNEGLAVECVESYSHTLPGLFGGVFTMWNECSSTLRLYIEISLL